MISFAKLVLKFSAGINSVKCFLSFIPTKWFKLTYQEQKNSLLCFLLRDFSLICLFFGCHQNGKQLEWHLANLYCADGVRKQSLYILGFILQFHPWVSPPEDWMIIINDALLFASHPPSALCVKVLCFCLVSCKSGAFSWALKRNLKRNYSVLFGYKGHWKFHI